MIAKITFFINAAKFGWSESYYASAEFANIEGFWPIARDAAGARKSGLGLGAEIVGVRISDVARPRVTALSGSSLLPSPSRDLTINNPWIAAEWIMTNPDGYKSLHLMRGSGLAPPYITGAPILAGLDKFTDQYRSQNQPFRNMLISTDSSSSQFGIWAFDKAAGTNTPRPVITVTIDDITRSWVLKLADVTGITTGTPVRIKAGTGLGLVGLRGLSKVWLVDSVAKTVTLTKRSANLAAPIYLGGGELRLCAKVFKQIRYIEYARWVKRDTGSAFFVTHGRANKQKLQ